MEKKKLKYLWFLPLAVLGIYTLIFVFTSYSDRALNRYFVKNSKIGATEFVGVDREFSNYRNEYFYYVASKYPHENSSEIFIVRNKLFLGFWDIWERSVPFAQGSNKKSGLSSVSITLRDDKGNKEIGNTLVLFGNTYIEGSSDLMYDIENEEGEKQTLYGRVSFATPFVVRLRYNGWRGQFGWTSGRTSNVDHAVGETSASSEVFAFYSGEDDVFKISNVRIVDWQGNVLHKF